MQLSNFERFFLFSMTYRGLPIELERYTVSIKSDHNMIRLRVDQSQSEITPLLTSDTESSNESEIHIMSLKRPNQ